MTAGGTESDSPLKHIPRSHIYDFLRVIRNPRNHKHRSWMFERLRKGRWIIGLDRQIAEAVSGFHGANDKPGPPPPPPIVNIRPFTGTWKKYHVRLGGTDARVIVRNPWIYFKSSHGRERHAILRVNAIYVPPDCRISPKARAELASANITIHYNVYHALAWHDP